MKTSEAMVKLRLHKAYRKLGVDNRNQLIARLARER
jgi:DNA-binding NarL/FixJ family response regulator